MVTQEMQALRIFMIFYLFINITVLVYNLIRISLHQSLIHIPKVYDKTKPGIIRALSFIILPAHLVTHLVLCVYGGSNEKHIDSLVAEVLMCGREYFLLVREPNDADFHILKATILGYCGKKAILLTEDGKRFSRYFSSKRIFLTEEEANVACMLINSIINEGDVKDAERPSKPEVL